MQRHIHTSDRGLAGKIASRVGAVLAMTGLFLLSACEGGGNTTVTENDLPEPGKDGVAPVLEIVTIEPNGNVEPGDIVKIEFTASEALMTPVVYINDVRTDVTGSVRSWSAAREMTEFEPQGFVTFTIVYQDISGEIGEPISATTNDSVACIGAECPGDDLGPLEGSWRMNFAGVGPAAGDTTWFNISDTGPDGPRACWFDDAYTFGADGSFSISQGDETWVEGWQGAAEDGCAAPVAPHDGSNNAVFEYDEEGATLQLTGVGAFLGLAKAVNGAELAAPGEAPESVTYEVVELVGDSLTIRIYAGGTDPEVWWEFSFTRISNSPIVGNWKMNFAGVGPAAGDTTWFSISDTGPDGPRACWFDDTYQFGRDGSFSYVQGDETWVEGWQGAAADGCAAPVAPHNGSNNAVFEYDEEAATLQLTGLGAFLGLAKAVNGAELAAPAEAPESVTYEVVELVGDSLTIRIYAGGTDPTVWWEFRLTRISNLPVVGNWKLDFAGVGPAAGDTTWFSIGDTGPDGPRACWFDDVYHIGGDGSFQNFMGGETWVETWQGAAADGCAAPVAPHDGSTVGAWYYDEAEGTMRLDGVGSFLGLAKAVNGAELAAPGEAPEFVTYEVVELVGDLITIRIYTGGVDPEVWWEFDLLRN